MALKLLGISHKRAAAILFIVAGLSAAAPPVNIWAMILCAGTAIPYVGFRASPGRARPDLRGLHHARPGLEKGAVDRPRLGPPGDARGAGPDDLVEGRSSRSWSFSGRWRPTGSFPFATPILGLPLQFTLSALAAWLVSPGKIKILSLSRDTVKRLLPLISTVVIVGMLQQIMTATGVRGLLSFAVISIPLVFLLISLAIVIPVSEGVLTYGAAAVLGIPLVWYLDSIGFHATVAIAGLTLLWPLGDGLPPTALIGRLSVMVSDYKGSYWDVIKTTWLPWIFITIVGILMVVYSAKLSFLVRWSM